MSAKRRPATGAKRKRKKWLMNRVVEPIGFSFGCVALALLSPILLPFVAVAEWFTTRQKRAVVARFACTRCGALLGSVSLSLADDAWGEHCQRLHNEHPGVMFRLVRTLDAVCPQCGQWFTYWENEKTFKEQADGEMASVET